MSSPITTHILDTSLGRPAVGVAIALHQLGDDGDWHTIASGVTDDDGRIGGLLEGGQLERATYRMHFQTGDYFRSTGREGFYPHVSVVFQIDAPDEHYHVPLLLNPFGYSTYRGS